MEAAPLITDAVQRLKSVFLEMPGTRLTLAEASRLSGLDRTTCQHVLAALEDVQFLKCGRDGISQQRSTDSPNS
ncbi:MAG: hypothetical protein HY657_17245 [Acidobacteria bacterium]|nr:hypothetical protein [Acidobacteriota bacterium]